MWYPEFRNTRAPPRKTMEEESHEKEKPAGMGPCRCQSGFPLWQG